MRDIKFRAWDKKGGFMLGVGVMDFEHKSFRPYHCSLDIDFDDCIFMQYTGLKDKNSEDIYEGDIIRLADGRIRCVGWSRSRAGFEPLNWLRSSEIEIIGNIHRNPELVR